MTTPDSHDKPAEGKGPVSNRPNGAVRAEASVPVRHARPEVIRCGSLTVRLGRTPRIMGVLNLTPDSFSDGGRFLDTRAGVARAVTLCESGAHIIDIGGESTRPGSDPVSAGEELDRVLPVIDTLTRMRERREVGDIPLSIDTRKAEVANEALRHGCHIINDVSAASDPEMIEVLRDHPDVPIVLMHMKGDPKTMQEAPTYDDVVGEVTAFLDDRAQELVRAGVARERIIVDPGIGFGKRFHDNLELLNRVDSLRALGYSVLIGASRKRFLGELLDAGPDDRLPGSLAAAAACFEAGVDIVRAHDVRETAGLFRVLDAIRHPGDYKSDW
jgi:dihydropteroate synthase